MKTLKIRIATDQLNELDSVEYLEWLNSHALIHAEESPDTHDYVNGKDASWSIEDEYTREEELLSQAWSYYSDSKDVNLLDLSKF